MVIYCIVDEPNAVEQYHSSYAQQIVHDILKEILPYMNIYQDEELTGINEESAENTDGSTTDGTATDGTATDGTDSTSSDTSDSTATDGTAATGTNATGADGTADTSQGTGDAEAVDAPDTMGDLQ